MATAKKAAAPKKKAAIKKTTTKKTAAVVAKKAAPKEVAVKSGKIAEIIKLHQSGKTNKEIVELGYNKSTVSIQVGGYKKDPKAYKSKYGG